MEKISLCMIVRDEEQHIDRCLDSVRGIVDEIVVVDTGSRDRTVEICKAYGAIVRRLHWKGNFAEARNYGLEEASCPWILYLDADEELSGIDREEILKAKQAEEVQQAHLLSLRVVNYTGESPDEDQVYVMEQYRMFRNGLGLRFKNRIHETLNVKDVLASPIRIALPATIYHYGYMDHETRRRQKFKRNMHILSQELARPDHDPWVEYHIASEYYRIGREGDALRYVNQSIISFLKNNHHPPSLIYKLKYEMMLNPEHAKHALSSIDYAISLHSDYVDLQYYKGVLLYMNEKYAEGLETLDQCLAMGEDNARHLTLKGTGSYRAWHYKGKCYEKLGQRTRARICYERAIALAPTYQEAAKDLKRLTWSTNSE